MNKVDFPIFDAHPALVFLDSASTAQKPRTVIDAQMQCYTQNYANVHRGIYQLSESATTAFEAVRQKTADFIHAATSAEIIFTKGTTEAINLVAQSFGLSAVKAGDEIVVSVMDHHANIVPWQMLCERTGAQLKIIPLNALGELDMTAYEALLTERTKLVAVIHVSNVLGTINPVKQMIAAAHQKNIPVLLDGAQAIGHIPVDVQALDCDFYVFSAHKLYGPTGLGILYGKENLLEKMPPYQTGGSMISEVTFKRTTFRAAPYKFEAGTPNIAGVAGLGAAIDYITQTGFEKIQSHENALLHYATTLLQPMDGLVIYGTSPTKSGVISFALRNVHPHDVATVLDQSHIAVRAGHHCAMPLMAHLKVNALTRVSLGLYNTLSDVDALIAGLEDVQKIFN